MLGKRQQKAGRSVSQLNWSKNAIRYNLIAILIVKTTNDKFNTMRIRKHTWSELLHSLKAAEWLTKNREVTTAENEALSQYCKKAAQQFQLALQGHQKNRNACWWSCLTYFESNSDPLVKVATIAEASAQALSQGAESLLRVHDNKKNLEASLKAATEESLDLWSTALEQLKIVFGMNTQATQALRTGNSEEARLSAGAAQEAERNFMKEVEKIQEEKIKLLLNAFGTHH